MTQEPQRTLSIPEIYTDAVEISINPFTVRLIVGSAKQEGFAPALSLTLNPEFARYLHRLLGQALEQHQALAAPQ